METSGQSDRVSEVFTTMANETVVLDSLGAEATAKLKTEGHLEH